MKTIYLLVKNGEKTFFNRRRCIRAQQRRERQSEARHVPRRHLPDSRGSLG